MKVLHVNNIDLHGRRFNGYDLITDLRSRGVDGKQAVLTKLSRNPRVFSLWSSRADEQLHGALRRVEQRRSMNNLIFPWGRALAATPEFMEADVVHYHLIHNEVIGLLDLPMLFSQRPSVWTFHDPWPLTGHCIHPLKSRGWLTGCHDCPSLDEPFPMDRDFAYRMLRIKKRIFADANVHIVVASEFMRDMVSRSPLTSHLKSVHLIPFGVDASAYLPEEERTRSREQLGIPRDDFVVLFRASTWNIKGLGYILDALNAGPPGRPTTLLTVGQKGLVDSLPRAFRVAEFGWVEDNATLARIYSASDVLLMPSTGESFGLMALEAMASGRPVISFDGTAVPWVTHAPECGIAVRMGDATALREAMNTLASNPDESRRRGQLGREIAVNEYSHDVYLDSLASLYAEVSGATRS